MENGEDKQEDQDGEQSPFVPDLGLPSDESVNHGQGGNGAAAGGAVGGGEAPLSFRRFLEPTGPVSLGRPDVAAGLPDFVQDHLAPAAAAVARQSPAATATGTRRKVPSSGSSSAGGAAALPAGQPLGLPDFLSDGPMGSLHSAADGPGRAALHGPDPDPNGARLRPARAAAESTLQRIQRLERENACLRQDVERLQQQLQHERRRTATLQGQLNSSAAAAPAASSAPPSPAAAAPGDGDSRLQQEVRSLRAQNAELRRRADSSQQAVSEIEAAAASTEQLISQLTFGVRTLRSIAGSLGPAAAAPGDGAPDPDPGRPPSGDSPC